MIISLDDIQNAIVKQLKSSCSSLKTVDRYKGQVDDLNSLPFNKPAAFVSYSGSTLKVMENKSSEDMATFTVILIETAINSNKVSEYTVLEEINTALGFQNLGMVDLLPLQPVSVKLVIKTSTIVAHDITFKTQFRRDY